MKQSRFYINIFFIIVFGLGFLIYSDVDRVRADEIETASPDEPIMKEDYSPQSGWYKENGFWYYYEDGALYEENTTLIKGKLDGVTGWYAVTDGKYDASFTGIAKTTTGKWYFARNGRLDKTYSGLALATNNIWYYVTKGVIDRTYTGKLAPTPEGKLYYVNKGKPTKNFTGKIAFSPTNSTWYYCTNGRPDLKFSGKFAYCTNGNWYYVNKGKIDKSFTGIAEATNGNEYYAKNGKLDKSFNGNVQYKGERHKVVNGVLKHNWVWKTHTEYVHKSEQYLVTPAWDEPIYENHSFCNGCGTDLTATYGGATTDAASIHLSNCGTGYHSGNVQVGTVHHDDVYDTDEWDEEVEVKDYQYCSKCGERK